MQREISEEDLARSAKAEALSRTIVEPCDSQLNIIVHDFPEIQSFGQIFAYETIRILIRSTLSRMARMRKLNDDRLKPVGCFCDLKSPTPG